jgi:hypothetical protein
MSNYYFLLFYFLVILNKLFSLCNITAYNQNDLYCDDGLSFIFETIEYLDMTW